MRTHRTGCMWSCACLLSGALTGCIEGFDSANGSDKAYYRLYDYTIDRPRVMGMAYWPIYFSSGDTVTFDALAATPEHLTDPDVDWWGCGVSLEQPFQYYGVDCLGTSIVEYLGNGTSLTLTMPQYDTSSCVEEGCYSYIPVFAIVHGETAEDTADGYGVTYIYPDYLDEYGNTPLESDLHDARITFTMQGSESGLVTVSPGAAVSLQALVETYDTDLQFNWYVSAGTLENYGVTRSEEVELEDGIRRNKLYGRNTLIVPQDFGEGTIQVYLTIDTVSYYYPGLERFAGGTIEVQP